MLPIPLAVLTALALGSVAPSAAAHGSLEDRLAAVDAAIAQRPRDGAIFLARAALLREEGEPQRALLDLARAAALGAEPRALERERGLALLDAGRPAEAAAALARALEGRPTDAVARAGRARALVALGRPREAAAEYERALADAPRAAAAPDWALARARALASGRAPDLDAAIRALDEARAQLGPLVVLEREAMALELRLGRTDASIARLDRITALSRRRETWLLERAEILERAGRREPALAAYAAALEEIDRLAPHRQATPAMQRVVTDASAGLARLAAAGGNP
jgi:tetratricopeptide (TPR) repeat protein